MLAQHITETAPLRISHAPRPRDIRLKIHAAPDAPLGVIDVQLGFGKGSGGRGQRLTDDTALYVSTLRRLAEHLIAYAADFEDAATADC